MVLPLSAAVRQVLPSDFLDLANIWVTVTAAALEVTICEAALRDRGGRNGDRNVIFGLIKTNKMGQTGY